jgi:lipopolysaccharide export system protein LptA
LTSLDGDAVSEAVFTGNVIFEEEDLTASAPEVHYQPSKNTIALSSPDAAGVPHVAIDQLEIDARRINVTLDSRQISASQVKTTLRPRPAASRGAGAKPAGARAMPGLLKQDDLANVNADRLEYVSATGQATYTGAARLFQGATSISGDSIIVDRERGDLTATGSARSTLDLETGRVTGSGDEIRYVDSTRAVTYSAAPVGPTRGRGGVSASAPGGRGVPEPPHEALVRGPQGDLRAERIDIVLAKSDNRMDRLEAFTRVTLKMENKSGAGSRLTYQSADERYLISGAGAVPATVVVTSAATASAPQSCREWTGRTLTFSKATDTINVDGNDETRTQMRNVPCALPSSR